MNPTLEHPSKFQEGRRKNGKRKKLNQSHFNQEKTSFGKSLSLDPLSNSLVTWSPLTTGEHGILKFLAGHIDSLNKIRILLSKEEKRRCIRQAARRVFYSRVERWEQREYRIRLHSHQLKTQQPNRKCTFAKEIQNYELFTVAKSLTSLVMSNIKDKCTNISVSFSLVIQG